MTTTENHVFAHLKALLNDLYQHCATQPPFCLSEASETDLDVLAALEFLESADQRDESFSELGQYVLNKIVSSYPHVTPSVNRDLFWLFGGDCLHFLSDEEIQGYQRVDELLYERQQAEDPITFAAAKASVFKMH